MRVYHHGQITESTPEQDAWTGLDNGNEPPNVERGYYQRICFRDEGVFEIEVWSKFFNDDDTPPPFHSMLFVADAHSWDVVMFPEMLDQVEYLARIAPGMEALRRLSLI